MKHRARHPLVVCGAHPGHGEAVAAELAGFGYDVRHCADEDSLVETASALRPQAIVYELQHQLSVDLAILSLVRSVLPYVPLVVVAGDLAEQAARGLRALHPTVLGHEPVSRGELRDALRRAIRRSRESFRREHAAAGA